MIKREAYLRQVRPFYDSDLIKVITGIRRSGKSVLLEQIMEEIRERTANLIYLNFEDRRVCGTIVTGDDLIAYVEAHRKEGRAYLFFDEIQTLSGWQEACKTLRLGDNSLFVTGSNSKLLSGEITKELSGRFVSFRVRPFVYRELCAYAKSLGKSVSVADYLVWGGFPKRMEFDGEEAMRRYLDDLDLTIVQNDLIQRHKIRKEALFRSLVDYVLRSNARIFSAKSVHDYLKSCASPCSVNTVMKYLSYLEEAYIIETVKQYSSKTKELLRFYVKLYCEDVSLCSLRAQGQRYDLSHNMENVVYRELLFMGYELWVYQNGKKEIDFLAVKGNKRYYVQVAYSVVEEKAYEREMSAFAGLPSLDQRILITHDELDYSTSAVRHIKLKDFLLMESLD